jgi:hypothetical protein
MCSSNSVADGCEGFEKHGPKAFTALVTGFTDYKT